MAVPVNASVSGAVANSDDPKIAALTINRARGTRADSLDRFRNNSSRGASSGATGRARGATTCRAVSLSAALRAFSPAGAARALVNPGVQRPDSCGVCAATVAACRRSHLQWNAQRSERGRRVLTQRIVLQLT